MLGCADTLQYAFSEMLVFGSFSSLEANCDTVAPSAPLSLGIQAIGDEWMERALC